jgi:hypothetical protein
LNVLRYFLFPSNHYLIINTEQEEHMVTPQATLPSIIFFGVESPPLSKIIALASFFSAYSTIPVTIDAGVTMTSDLKSIH